MHVAAQLPQFTVDCVRADDAGTLHGLLDKRVERSPDSAAYRQFEPASGTWRSYSWREVADLVRRWRAALTREGMAQGDRVAVRMRNSVEWVCFDQAAQALGLVVVALYTTDNARNIAYILKDAGARLLLVGELDEWLELAPLHEDFPALERVLCASKASGVTQASRASLSFLEDWLAAPAPSVQQPDVAPDAMATIIYTSGTTGQPKGVMLSHRNILWNVEAVLELVPGYTQDLYLSFLPLSHAFERTVGYYLPMLTGSEVAFARSIEALSDDLLNIRPTMLVSVPRIYERVYAALQLALEQRPWPIRAPMGALFRWAMRVGWRRFQVAQRGRTPGLGSALAWQVVRLLVARKLLARLGGRLRLALCGGAPLPRDVSHCLLSLGLPLLQGYGLTEAAPIVTGNPEGDNISESVGIALPGVELRLGSDDELLVRSPGVMLGYWRQPDATAQTIDAQGWLRTGDQARIENEHVYITGRLKDIIVTSTGEKVPPTDVEFALTQDALIDQAMIVGEGRPFIAGLLVLNPNEWSRLAATLGIAPDAPGSLALPAVIENVLERCDKQLSGFPSFARVRTVWLTLEDWSIDNGLYTPTMKLKRAVMEQRFKGPIEALYVGHTVPRVFDHN